MKKTKTVLYLLALTFIFGCLMIPAKTVYAGNSFSAADGFPMGARVTQTYTEEDKEEYYKFTTPGGQAFYSLTMYNVGSGRTKYIKVYDSPSFSGNILINLNMYSSGNKAKAVKLKPNHTYYIYIAAAKAKEKAPLF